MNNLKILREERNLTLREMAALINVSNNAISQWENGKRQPDNQMLIKLADFFDVSIDFLLNRKYEQNKYSFKTELHEELFNLINQLDNRYLYQVKGFVLGCIDNMNNVSTSTEKIDVV